ncbi:MAG: CDP-alcohol phosphatidyltransferase family protein [Humibacillus sp.]|nr:CDP-alcohol phosphatidyltransferase family protein [Humibacillus sp.]
MSIAHDPTDNRPTIAELRAVAQPPEHIARYNAEHWAGSLYLRHLSIYVTRLLLPTGITANGVTGLMIGCGLLGAAALLIPGLTGAFIAMVAMQLQILFDCSDGEVARWRQRFSPAGIWLDRVGHYTTEAAIPIALGLRADSWTWSDPLTVNVWTVLGFLVAVLVLITKSFTDLVHVARAKSGREVLADVKAMSRPKSSGLARARQMMSWVPIYRAFIAIEASILIFLAAIIDEWRGDLIGTQWLLVLMVPAALATAAGHFLGVMTSARLD